MVGYIMIIRPIPKELLIHEISYKEAISDDGWDGSFVDAVIIGFVRVDPASSIKRTQTSEGSTVSHIVFVDRVNSTVFPEFKKKSKIIWNGQTFEISEVKPFYDISDVPHHYELGLS